MLPFGETVWLWRTARGLSQEALSRASGVTRPNLSAIERGRREVTLTTLRALAAALGVRPGVLADGVSPYGPPQVLSRAALERVAHAAATGRPLSNAQESALASCLRDIVGTLRDKPARSRPRLRRPSDKASALAYLKLKAMTSPETLASLQARVGPYLQAA